MMVVEVEPGGQFGLAFGFRGALVRYARGSRPSCGASQWATDGQRFAALAARSSLGRAFVAVAVGCLASSPGGR